MLISVNGLVLRASKYGDCDKMITLLTKEYGIISVGAKGSKNLKSRLLSGTQQFCYGTFSLYSSKNKYSLNDAELIENFYNLRTDIVYLALAGYICELASVLAPENQDSGELLPLVLNSLFLASKMKKPASQIKAVFELRAMSLSGFAPDIVACNGCGCFENDVMYFSPGEGILFCKKCFDGLSEKPADVKAISPEVLYAMRFIVFSEPKKIFSFTMDKRPLDALAKLCEDYVGNKTDRSFTTLDFYNTVKD